MPLDEEGAKWSCEPCVRGHRSSKCQHFDRMMMKVPKAGRPLAKCPHPKGTCSCQKLYAFMVRIPKGSTCLCRPLYKVPMVMTETGQQPQPAPEGTPQSTPQSQPVPEMGPPPPPPPSAPVTSPTGKSNANTNGNKVQKPQAKRQNSVKSMSELSTKDLASHPAVSIDQNIPIAPSPTTNFSPVYPSSVSYPQNGTYYPAYSSSQQFLSTRNPHSPPQGNDQKGSCCSTKTSSADTAPAGRSCCSKVDGVDGQQQALKAQKETGSGTQSAPHAQNAPPPFVPDAAGWSETQSKAGLLPHINTGHSVSAPVTGYSSPSLKPQYGGSQYISSNQTFPPSTPVYSQTSYDMTTDPSHNCGCGDGCQCLGCASHPFNDTTRQHIQEMGYLMALREDSPKENQSYLPYNEQQQQPTYLKELGYAPTLFNNNNNVYQPNQTHSNVAGHFEHTANIPNLDPLASLPAATSKSSAHGQSTGTEGQMMMQPSAYLTVEYPVGLLDPCSNLSGTCQCGSSCMCVGCLTHNGHNGVPLEPSPPPENAATDFASIAGVQQTQLSTRDDISSYQISALPPGRPPGEYQPDSLP